MQVNELKTALTQARILVVGDVMLDRYWFGEVERISPEAPVPVAKIGRTEVRAGGAANVARNIAALGGQAQLLAVIGDDAAGHELEGLLTADHIDTHLHRDTAISTTVKLRVIARQQQLIRVDFEDQPHHEVLASKLDDYLTLLPDTDLVILSDYGKGGLSHVQQMIAAAKAAGKPVLIDPKGSDYGLYRGATLLTPNRSEFKQVAGGWSSEAELAQKAEALRSHLEFEALLITRSEEGMSLFRQDSVLNLPTVAREVYDVSGAGDTVIGILGLMLAAGLPIEKAIVWANRAAGIVVGKLGTAVISQNELFDL